MRSFFRFILATKAIKSSISKTSGTYPDMDFHWFLGFLSDQLPLRLVVELSLGIYHFYFKSVTENKKISGFRDIIEVCI